jgi:hypothetical protein
MIRLLTGPDLGVPQIPECLVVEWYERGHRVVFSYARQGNAITMHFAAAKESLREVKTAINDFVEWALWAYPWCEMMFGVIGIKSVERLVKKCGFSFLTEAEGYQVYMRARQ